MESPTRHAPTVTDELRITGRLVRDLVAAGGYVHRLFAGDGSPSSREHVPVPGPALVFLAAGLVERSGAMDDAVAMVGIEELRFHEFVFAGTAIRVEIEEGDSRTSSGGRLIERSRWRVVNDDGDLVADLVAVMMTSEGKAGSCGRHS